MKRKRIIKSAGFILGTLIILFTLIQGMKATDPTSTMNIQGFYQEKENSLDVLLIGASEVYTSFIPSLAWQEYGFTSYNLSSPGIPGDLYKPLLKEGLKHQKPKVVAIELNGFLHGDDYYQRPGQRHNIIDNMGYSSNWVETIQNTIPKEEQKEYFFPLTIYHSMWDQPQNILLNIGLRACFSLKGQTYMKGYSTFSETKHFPKYKRKGKMEFTDKSARHLEDLLQYCRQEGLENVIFYRTPHARLPKNQDDMEEVWNLIHEYGYDVMDYSVKNSISEIDVNTDFYNREHLNVRGAEKFTDAFGLYLKDNYLGQIKHDEKVEKAWNKTSKIAYNVLEKCNKDTDLGVKRYYSEGSVYIQMPVLPE